MKDFSSLSLPEPGANSNPLGNLDSDSSVASLVDESIDALPRVNEQVLAAMNAGGSDEDSTTEKKVDSAGVEFNPEIHSGTQTATGKWRKKKGATNSILAGKPKEETQQEPGAQSEQVLRAKAAMIGTAGANALFMMGQALGGEEWAPISINKEGVVKIEEYDEREMMEKAIADWAFASGKTEVSPNMGLMVALTAYMLPRFRMPKTQTKMKSAKEWLASKYLNWKLKRKGKQDHGSQSDVGNDGKRENVTRQATR